MKMQEWEKTVIQTGSDANINNFPIQYWMLRQAELSFKSRDKEVKDAYNAGYQKAQTEATMAKNVLLNKVSEKEYRAGIKEVVDWVINHYDDGLYLDEFKKQVKEWGVE
jgi:hypothetical protein